MENGSGNTAIPFLYQRLNSGASNQIAEGSCNVNQRVVTRAQVFFRVVPFDSLSFCIRYSQEVNEKA